MIVIMQFGDGSFKTVEVTSDDPETAVEEAKTWVSDNAWFEVSDEEGTVLAETNLN